LCFSYGAKPMRDGDGMQETLLTMAKLDDFVPADQE
jgi:hypothetical protein